MSERCSIISIVLLLSTFNEPLLSQMRCKLGSGSLYEYPEIGLKIKQPENWDSVEYGKSVKAQGDSSLLEEKSDKFRVFVQLRIENLSSSNLAKILTNSSIRANPDHN